MFHSILSYTKRLRGRRKEERLTWKEGAVGAPMALDHEMHTAKIYIRNAHVEILESPKP